MLIFSTLAEDRLLSLYESSLPSIINSLISFVPDTQHIIVLSIWEHYIWQNQAFTRIHFYKVEEP